MAHKNKLKKTRYDNIYELEMSNGKMNYIAKFIHNSERYAGRNLTKIFGVKTAALADKKLDWIRIKLSEGVDVFNVKSVKVEDLLFQYLDTRSDEYNKVSRFYYNKHIKPVIGHLHITKVEKHHLETIKKNMENLGLASSTIKKARTILHPIFQDAFDDEIVRRNVIKKVKMGVHGVKPKLTDRLNEPLIQAIRKIYQAALKEENDYNLFALISIMCARRFNELSQLYYEDIIDGVVNVRAETTKTFKDLHPKMTAEQYPLPKEVLEIIGTEPKSGKLFKHWHRTYMDKYATMMKDKVDLDYKPLAKDYPIRSHDNRNFITSIMSKKYGIDYIGAACLSHHQEKSNVNARYNNIEYQDKIEIYNEYWKILREEN